MGFLKASGKFAARTVNDKVLKKDLQKAQADAYKETGRRLSHAKLNGYHINGAKTYRKCLNRRVNEAKAKHSNRDKFISDL